MKNFLEATAIKPTLRINGKIKLTPSVSHIRCMVIVNGITIFNDWLKEEANFNFDLPVDASTNISIQARCQRWDEYVDIQVLLEDFEIIPKFQQFANPKTNRLDFSCNTWRLQMLNFYTWFHKITGQGWII
jgi:uridine kinase